MMVIPEGMDNDGAIDGPAEVNSRTASRFRVANEAADGVTVADVGCAVNMDR